MHQYFQADIQRCDLEFEPWASPVEKLTLHWDGNNNWINPKLNSTLNMHTLHAIFEENEPNIYSNG